MLVDLGLPRGEDLEVVQLTDCHLGAEPGSELLGLDTDDSLQRVIRLALKEHSSPSLYLATGDIADSGTLPAYQRFARYACELPAPVFCLTGNHDLRSNMEQALSEEQMATQVLAGDWQVVMLDSQVPGQVGGNLAADQLELLEHALVSHQDRHTLVCLHHHPVPSGCAWLDTQVVRNADQLFRVLDAFPNARALLWGHVHQEQIGDRHGLLMIGSPSTCVQFHPDSDAFRADTRGPGYRWLKLGHDGSVSTGVSRVTDHTFEIDFTAKGY